MRVPRDRFGRVRLRRRAGLALAIGALVVVAGVPVIAQESPSWPGKAATIPLLGGVPDSPPRTAPPPGAMQPPAPVPPEPAQVSIYAHVDTVTAGPGESEYGVDPNLSCVRSSVFARGMRIVWRMEMVDATSGKILQGSDVTEALISIPGADPVSFRFGRHGPTEDSPWFFAAVWDIPPDYPLGALDHAISVTLADGRTLPVTMPLSAVAPTRIRIEA